MCYNIINCKCGDFVNKYFRFSYNEVGIYEALKKEIWNSQDNPIDEWNTLKISEAFTWLKVPSSYPENSYSYFTEEGYRIFIKKSYPVFSKYLDKDKIVMEEYIFDDDKLDIVYQDEHQIVVQNK